MPAVRWFLHTARPRTASELFALSLTLLGVGTLLAVLGHAAIHLRRPTSAAFWCSLLFAAALVARLTPYWHPEVKSMTAKRARSYVGSLLLLFVALEIAWRVVSSTLGWDGPYPLLGSLSRLPWALVVFAISALFGIGLILDVPVAQWLAGSVRPFGVRWKVARERRVLARTEVAYLPEALAEIDDEEEFPPFVRGTAQPAPQLAEIAPVLQPMAVQVPLRASVAATPPIDLFAPVAKRKAAPVDLDATGRRIEDTLASFNVGAHVVGHHYGPTVTQFDIQPDKGVKVKSIVALQNDLALALAAPTIRIQAPVPGKPVVGIEIPNASATTVALRELLESDAYTKLKSPLGVVLGKDVAGAPAVIDLAKMPHLLIAGATGSGKSVCVNALISCLLYRNTPEDVRLMMIDPKMVELTVYNGVPHLLSPVVTQMDKVVGVLQWAIREMERRYKLFADNAVRNIARYNEKIEAANGKRLPYIVLIIDELADLMMVSPEDVEDAICRLAQLARACGIHLVIATQRPSVDVVTGLIKANFPARIAFAMTSQIDSRTILDSGGAEKLLGRGDMLYMPPDAPKPVRLQGAFLSDQEIEQLVEFWQQSPSQTGVHSVAAEEFVAAQKEAVDSGDELLGEATRVVREFRHASVTLLQRRLRVGYARAARLMDQLEDRGVVGPADGSKQRPVLPEGGESAATEGGPETPGH
ncbi:MAG: DNA translocase FtsK [Chloroflexota bacterium]